MTFSFYLATREQLEQIIGDEICEAELKQAAKTELDKRIAKQRREKRQEKEMLEIYDSLEYVLSEHIVQADSVVRTMISEMMTFGVPSDRYIPFLQSKLAEMIQKLGA